MELSFEKLPKSQVEIKIKLSPKEFSDFFEKTVIEMGKDKEIKGFRKGSAPREILIKEIGEDNILIEAAKTAAEESYKKAIEKLSKENNFEVIAQPELKIEELGKDRPLVLKAKINILPEIELPDYKKIASQIKAKDIVIDDKEIDDSLKYLQSSRAKFSLKNGKAEKGDFVEIEYSSPQFKGTEPGGKTKDAFILGQGKLIPGFEDNLVGLEAGQEKEFSLELPEGHQLRKYGDKLDFKVKINSVQKVELPEINDEFAKSLGAFKNLGALKENIREGIIFEKKQAESRKIRDEILEEISKKTKCELPEVLLRREKERIMSRFKNNILEKFKIPWPDYLEKIGKTEEEVLESFAPQAEKSVRKLLVLNEIGKREKISVSEGEISSEVNKILRQYPNPEEARKNIGLDAEELKNYTKEAIRTEKTLAALEEMVNNRSKKA